MVNSSTVGVFVIAMVLSFSIVSLVFFRLRYLHKRKNPTEDDIRETNRQRREREKLKRETTKKVNAYMNGESYSGEKEHIPNGKRCGKYKKKNKRK